MFMKRSCTRTCITIDNTYHIRRNKRQTIRLQINNIFEQLSTIDLEAGEIILLPSLLRSHLHMAFPERDRQRGKRESGASAEAKRGASGGFSLPRLSLSSPPPLANDLALEMPYGDDCGGG